LDYTTPAGRTQRCAAVDRITIEHQRRREMPEEALQMGYMSVDVFRAAVWLKLNPGGPGGRVKLVERQWHG
jgi:hypothetical protein